jgi:hypothetical protein
MTIPFDMRRLHHGCGESLKIKPCVLSSLGRQAGQMTRPGFGMLPDQPSGWNSKQTREATGRLWG